MAHLKKITAPEDTPPESVRITAIRDYLVESFKNSGKPYAVRAAASHTKYSPPQQIPDNDAIIQITPTPQNTYKFIKVNSYESSSNGDGTYTITAYICKIARYNIDCISTNLLSEQILELASVYLDMSGTAFYPHSMGYMARNSIIDLSSTRESKSFIATRHRMVALFQQNDTIRIVNNSPEVSETKVILSWNELGTTEVIDNDNTIAR